MAASHGSAVTPKAGSRSTPGVFSRETSERNRVAIANGDLEGGEVATNIENAWRGGGGIGVASGEGTDAAITTSSPAIDAEGVGDKGNRRRLKKPQTYPSSEIAKSFQIQPDTRLIHTLNEERVRKVVLPDSKAVIDKDDQGNGRRARSHSQNGFPASKQPKFGPPQPAVRSLAQAETPRTLPEKKYANYPSLAVSSKCSQVALRDPVTDLAQKSDEAGDGKLQAAKQQALAPGVDLLTTTVPNGSSTVVDDENAYATDSFESGSSESREDGIGTHSANRRICAFSKTNQGSAIDATRTRQIVESASEVARAGSRNEAAVSPAILQHNDSAYVERDVSVREHMAYVTKLASTAASEAKRRTESALNRESRAEDRSPTPDDTENSDPIVHNPVFAKVDGSRVVSEVLLAKGLLHDVRTAGSTSAAIVTPLPSTDKKEANTELREREVDVRASTINPVESMKLVRDKPQALAGNKFAKSELHNPESKGRTQTGPVGRDASVDKNDESIDSPPRYNQALFPNNEHPISCRATTDGGGPQALGESTMGEQWEGVDDIGVERGSRGKPHPAKAFRLLWQRDRFESSGI